MMKSGSQRTLACVSSASATHARACAAATISGRASESRSAVARLIGKRRSPGASGALSVGMAARGEVAVVRRRSRGPGGRRRERKQRRGQAPGARALPRRHRRRRPRRRYAGSASRGRWRHVPSALSHEPFDVGGDRRRQQGARDGRRCRRAAGSSRLRVRRRRGPVGKGRGLAPAQIHGHGDDRCAGGAPRHEGHRPDGGRLDAASVEGASRFDVSITPVLTPAPPRQDRGAFHRVAGGGPLPTGGRYAGRDVSIGATAPGGRATATSCAG